MLDDEITEKQCTLCKKVKPVAEFISAFTSGYANRCAECRERGQRAHKKYIKKDVETWNAWQAKYVKRRKGEKPKPGHRICQRCLGELPNEQFPIGTQGKRMRLCIKCRAYYAAHTAKWRKKHPEKARVLTERAKEKHRERRRKCLEHYGKQCACCGVEHTEFLAIDHVNGKGGIHRAEMHAGSIYGWLIRNNFPEGFRTLCFNCNWSFGCYGYCPHQSPQAASAA